MEKAPAGQQGAAPEGEREGINKNTFATTCKLNENHACGYPKPLLEKVAPTSYDVALSGET